jgi:hypothetical protein
MRKVSITILIVVAAGAATLWVTRQKQAAIPQPTAQPPTASLATSNTARERATTPGPADDNERVDKVVARLAEAKARAKAQPTLHKPPPAPSAAPSVEKLPQPVDQQKMPSAEFLPALTSAVATADRAAIKAVLEKVPDSPECAASLKSLVTAPNSSGDLRRYAAEALFRSGSKESVEFVLDRVLAAQQAGDPVLTQELQYSLAAPTSVEGAKVLFEFLLGTGHYAGRTEPLPEGVRSAARKAIWLAPDQEGIGNLAADFYLDPQQSGRTDNLGELFNGVSHPSMLSALAVRAYQGGSPEEATRFLERLAQVDSQGAVSAFVRAAKQEGQLLNQAAAQVYTWSLQHPQQSSEGLFMESLTDSTRSPTERIVAAFGLAGIQDTELAKRCLDKALSREGDPAVMASLVALQGFLKQAETPK